MRQTCEGCKFWSELIAQSTDDMETEALCLNERSTFRGKFVRNGCDEYVVGRAIDDPPAVAPEINHDNWGNEGP